MMNWHGVAMFAALPLVGCDQVSEIEAFAKCTERTEIEIPAARGLTDRNFSEQIKGLGKTDPKGNFKFAVVKRDGSLLLTCSGNLTSRRIDEVSFEGAVTRPANADYWSY
jgi:hypothetical protein